MGGGHECHRLAPSVEERTAQMCLDRIDASGEGRLCDPKFDTSRLI
jgi:hypothetical protein